MRLSILIASTETLRLGGNPQPIVSDKSKPISRVLTLRDERETKTSYIHSYISALHIIDDPSQPRPQNWQLAHPEFLRRRHAATQPIPHP